MSAPPIFSPDSGRIAFGSPGSVEIWDIAEKRRLFQVSHGGPRPSARRLAFSPDGRLLVTAGWDGTTRIWDVVSGQELQRLEHNDEVEQIAFADHGAILVSKEDNGVARAWDATTGKELFNLSHGSADQKMIYSKGGGYVATVLGSRVRVWETNSGKALADVHHDQGAEEVALSSDGRFLATVQRDLYWGDKLYPPVQVWEVASGRELFRLEPGSAITSLRFSADDTRIVTGSSDNTARTWSAETGRELVRLSHTSAPEQVILSDDNNYLAARLNPGSGAETSFVVWHVPSRRVVARLPGYLGYATFRAAFRPGGSELAISEGDPVFRIGQTRSAQQNVLDLAPEGNVFELLFSPDSKRLAARMSTLDDVNHVSVWDLENGTEQFRVEHEAGIQDAALTIDGKRLATASDDKTARLWDMSNGLEILRLSHPTKVHKVGFSPDGRYLATHMGGIVTGCQCDQEKDLLQVWDAVTGEKTNPTIDGYVNGFLFSRDGQRLVTAEGVWGDFEHQGDAWDSNPLGFLGVRVWNIGSGEELLRIPHGNRVYFFELSPDGTTLMTNTRVGGGSGTLRLWDLATGRLKKDIPVTAENDATEGVVFTPDWNYVATRSNRKTNEVKLWDVMTGANLMSLVSEGSISHMAFAPNGKFLLIDSRVNNSQQISLWDWQAGRRVYEVVTSDNVNDVEFTPDGSHIVTVGRIVQLWAWRAEEMVLDACSRVERNLTREEWRTYLADEPYQETCHGLPIPEK